MMDYLLGFAALLHIIFLMTFLSNVYYLWRAKRKKTYTIHPPSLSVLIPARNEAENLQRLIPTLLKQEYPDFDIWVYNDSSTDETWQVLQSFKDFRLNPVQGTTLPQGWVGKVHGLYQLSQKAQKDVYLFLDADTELKTDTALFDWICMFQQLPQPAYLSGLPDLRGGGKALVSMVSFAILGALPLFLMRLLPFKSLSMLNGQFWIIRNAVYHHWQPHLHQKHSILEDVEIGRYLKSKKVMPHLADVSDNLAVWMYADLSGAWHGFRKNAYLIMGGNPIAFFLVFGVFLCAFIIAPAFSLPLLISLYLLKTLIDRLSNIPIWVSILTPFVVVMGGCLALHSAISHWIGNVTWKDRRV
jgi:Glycosyl transferase family 2